MIVVREFADGDWAAVWAIVEDVVRAAETFPYDVGMTEEDARAMWLGDRVTVAVEDGSVVGTAKMGANRGGPGAHISTASFMVAGGARGRGVGTALVREALSWAENGPYAGMQFNAVVETNRAAVRLYERFGFRVLGTVPGAFEHPALGRVGLHLMYKEF